MWSSPPCRGWVLSIAIWPAVSSFGLWRCCLAHHVAIIGPTVLLCCSRGWAVSRLGCSGRCGPLCVVVVSLSSPLCCHWAGCVVVDRGVSSLPFASLSTPLCCRWAGCVVMDPMLSSLGRSRRPRPRGVVLGLFPSSFGPPCRAWAVRIVLGLPASSLSPPCRCSAHRVVVWPALSPLGHSRCPGASPVVVWRALGIKGE